MRCYNVAIVFSVKFSPTKPDSSNNFAFVLEHDYILKILLLTINEWHIIIRKMQDTNVS